MAEAIAIFCIYMLPWIIAMCIGAFLFENVIPYFARKRARRRRDEFNREIHEKSAR